jgi:hypothetical protein
MRYSPSASATRPRRSNCLKVSVRDTTKVLRLFRDTLRALVAANDTGRNAIDVLDDEVGWQRLLQAQPEVEARVRDADPDPLLLAAERYSTIRKYTHDAAVADL